MIELLNRISLAELIIKLSFKVAVPKTFKLLPIPTPPVTTKEPVDVDVDCVFEVIATPEANVFNPNIVCAAPEINPVDAFPAKAI